MKIMLLPVIVAAAIAFAGCGSENNCGITTSGNKVCGDDAAAYCTLTGWPDTDEGTTEFCNRLARAGYRELQHTCLEYARVSGDVKEMRAAVRNCAPAD